MTDKLEMPLEQFAEAVAKENARLNEHNEKLKGQTKLYFDAFNKAIARIKQLEAALFESMALNINYHAVEEKNGYEFTEAPIVIDMARTALGELK